MFNMQYTLYTEEFVSLSNTQQRRLESLNMSPRVREYP